MSELPNHPFGRVEEDGTVYVIDAGVERQVGQYPDGTPEEALAYFTRKFDDLAGQLQLLEQRVRSGANPDDIAKGAKSLQEQLVAPNAVGDLENLRTRLSAISADLEQLSEQQHEQHQQELAEAIAYRESIVVEIEQLAAQPPASIQWKRTSAQVDELFNRWQQHQKEGPRIPKAEANALWKRFRAARTQLDSERRKFFAGLDAQHKQARDAKRRIITAAEALASKGAEGIPEYRRLLDEWKTVGRAGRKHDDALWAEFKAAGDVLFAAKQEIEARDNAEYAANLDAKLALLEEAEPILELTDRAEARKRLNAVQDKWDEIGRVPRERFKDVEDRLRKVEQHVRKLDEDYWDRTDPEKVARHSGLASQLHEAIEKLERELDEAKASGDQRKIKEAEEALAARRQWLNAIG